MSTENF